MCVRNNRSILCVFVVEVFSAVEFHRLSSFFILPLLRTLRIAHTNPFHCKLLEDDGFRAYLEYDDCLFSFFLGSFQFIQVNIVIASFPAVDFEFRVRLAHFSQVRLH